MAVLVKTRSRPWGKKISAGPPRLPSATGYQNSSENGCGRNSVSDNWPNITLYSFFLTGAHFQCKHFLWNRWQNIAYHRKLVLVGTDKHMPCQPGAMWVTRDKQVRKGVKQPALKQSHYLNLLKRITSPFNKGKGKDAYYDLEEGSIPLRIITLDDLSAICPGMFVSFHVFQFFY